MNTSAKKAAATIEDIRDALVRLEERADEMFGLDPDRITPISCVNLNLVLHMLKITEGMAV